jgi:hypothetical protein
LEGNTKLQDRRKRIFPDQCQADVPVTLFHIDACPVPYCPLLAGSPGIQHKIEHIIRNIKVQQIQQMELVPLNDLCNLSLRIIIITIINNTALEQVDVISLV